MLDAIVLKQAKGIWAFWVLPRSCPQATFDFIMASFIYPNPQTDTWLADSDENTHWTTQPEPISSKRNCWCRAEESNLNIRKISQNSNWRFSKTWLDWYFYSCMNNNLRRHTIIKATKCETTTNCKSRVNKRHRRSELLRHWLQGATVANGEHFPNNSIQSEECRNVYPSILIVQTSRSLQSSEWNSSRWFLSLTGSVFLNA